jgi:2-methylisocitrate lyase-like PEP mutase family enzyme
VSDPARALRALLDLDGPLVLPGAGTALEARLAAGAGFQAVYMSGYATAAAVHGLPDIGLIALDEIATNARLVVEAAGVPVVVDVDTGYGDVTNVALTVRRLARAGVAGIQLEDQQWPKRCGHLAGKLVEPTNVMLRKLDAALSTRGDDDLVIIARTDARAPLGLDEALDRARSYADAGADIIFVDAPESEEELRAIARAIPARSMVNMSEGGRTPLLSAAELGEFGFDVVLFPTSALRVSAHAVREFFAALATAGDSRGWLDRMMGLDDLNAAVGLAEQQRFEAEVLDRASARGGRS